MNLGLFRYGGGTVASEIHIASFHSAAMTLTVRGYQQTSSADQKDHRLRSLLHKESKRTKENESINHFPK
jgi:sugar diacid utilization regulator